MTDLKLLALDDEDLQVISAHVQDAVVRVEDMGLAKADRRFALLMNRFAWELDDERAKGQRKRAALRFEHVQSVESSGIDPRARDGVLDLLSISFAAGDAPAGTVVLAFAGGGTVSLQVDCLEAKLHDLGAAWAAKGKPAHELSDEAT